jgi:hypothetical protein
VASDSVLLDYSLTQGEPLCTRHHDLSTSPIVAVQARDEIVYRAQLVMTELANKRGDRQRVTGASSA